MSGESNGTVTKALAVLQGAVKNGALTFVTKEDCMAVTPLYKPEISTSKGQERPVG